MHFCELHALFNFDIGVDGSTVPTEKTLLKREGRILSFFLSEIKKIVGQKSHRTNITKWFRR